MAEYDVQWIGEYDWVWTTSFQLTADKLARPHHDLVFEGLDTFCKVYLVSQPRDHACDTY
jgi:beta-mannosidase